MYRPNDSRIRGQENAFDLIHHPSLHAVVGGIVVGTFGNQKRIRILIASARRWSSKSKSYSEVDVTAEAVGQSTLFHHLQSMLKTSG